MVLVLVQKSRGSSPCGTTIFINKYLPRFWTVVTAIERTRVGLLHPTNMKMLGPSSDTVARSSPVDSICRSSTRQHTVRSAHYTGLFGYWETGLL